MCKHGKTDRHTRTHLHTHKAPFRTRAYTDIKGPLFSPSYRYSTGGLCCEHIYVYTAVCFMSTSVCVWNHNMWSELSQTPSAPRADCHMGLCACALWFVFCATDWETTAVPPTMLREAEQLCLWRRLFVVVGRQEMRSCWGLWLCAGGWTGLGWWARRRGAEGREKKESWTSKPNL